MPPITTVHYLNHSEAMANRAPGLPPSDCPGPLVKRLHRSSRSRVCLVCGTRLEFGLDGQVYIADRPATVAEMRARKEVS